MGKNQSYLTTGEFAKLCHTTKHTLFHYCDIGLFLPAYTDENGYRYYHVLQYDTFLTIAQLRTIGMSLPEIKRYMSERSPQHMVELYRQQEERISEQIAQLMQIRERIKSQKNNILGVLTCTEEYFLEQQERRFLRCSAPVSNADDYLMATAIGDMLHRANGELSSNPSGMLCRLHDAMESEHYACCFYADADSRDGKNVRIKPEGTYLSTYHRGEYAALGQSYRDLVSYAAEHRIELDEWVYAQTVIGDWAVCTPQDYRTKVSVKVIER